MTHASAPDLGGRREIGLSKKKIVGLITIGVLFVALGAWLASLDSDFIASQRRWNNPFLIHGVGWASVAMGTLAGIAAVRKLLDKRPGLVLDEQGFLDNSSATSAGPVPWADVTGLDVFTVQKQRLLVVRVADPDKYIERGNKLRRMFYRANTGMTGSPININAGTLKIDFDEMLAVFQDYLARYGRPPTNGARVEVPSLVTGGGDPAPSANIK